MVGPGIAGGTAKGGPAVEVKVAVQWVKEDMVCLFICS
jgi:hypothetical protein